MQPSLLLPARLGIKWEISITSCNIRDCSCVSECIYSKLTAVDTVE